MMSAGLAGELCMRLARHGRFDAVEASHGSERNLHVP
jgi:hypothetical protein